VAKEIGMTGNPHGYTFNHTMLRVKDARASLAFYRDILGMTLLRRLDFEEGRFSLYFLAFLNEGEAVPLDEADIREYVFSRQGVLELTHNWGTEEEDGPVYHNGNANLAATAISAWPCRTWRKPAPGSRKRACRSSSARRMAA
jgi:lactoylglutathione lyase